MIIKRKLATNPESRSSTVPALKVEMGSFYIPKDNPSKPLGEDAHFVYSNKQVAGVADGVGGWASMGIDAGKYARDLIRNCIVAVAGVDNAAVVKPNHIMTEAHSRTTAAGTSTACVVSFDGVFLHAANLGDSGFAIFRGGKFLFRSQVQQRRFNCPYQMGRGKRSNTPAEAWRGKIRLVAGDMVIVATDGLFDNVFMKEIEELLAAEGAADTVEDFAGRLAGLALSNSLDRFRDGPFAVEARKAGFDCRGGKIDDITVIVGKCKASDKSSLCFSFCGLDNHKNKKAKTFHSS